MKAYSRRERIEGLIQRELAVIIDRELTDPRIDMVTISEIALSTDYAYAKVFVTVMKAEDTTKTVTLLNKAKKFLRGRLADRLSLRHVPELTFIYDDTITSGNRLLKLMEDNKSSYVTSEEHTDTGSLE